ncbi:MAG: cold-shock protein [Hyphomonadaceae bacterium]
MKFFNGARGFGFITPDGGGADVFVHVSAVERAGLTQLVEGQKVNFQTLPDTKGKGPKAVNLKVLD